MGFRQISFSDQYLNEACSHYTTYKCWAKYCSHTASLQGLGYKTSRVADAVPGARTPLLNFLSAAGLSYNAFTYYLHEIDPIPPLDSVVENQGQITFGNTLPDLVDSASGINAPALFQNVDLAWWDTSQVCMPWNPLTKGGKHFSIRFVSAGFNFG